MMMEMEQEQAMPYWMSPLLVSASRDEGTFALHYAGICKN